MKSVYVYLLVVGCLYSEVSAISRPTYRYNAGGDAVLGENPWEATDSLVIDGFSSTHATNSVLVGLASSVPASTPSEIFLTEIYRPCIFNFSGLSLEGTYEVQLYFVETYAPTASAGARVFDVLINGDKVLASYDVFADVGAYIGVMKSFNVDTSGGLQIAMEQITQFPSIKGIALIPRCPGGVSASMIPCDEVEPLDEDEPLDLPHPADVLIMRDMGGSGDGDLWFHSTGEFLTDLSDMNVFATTVPIDMSSDTLPTGVPMEMFQNMVWTRQKDLELKIPLRPERYNVTLMFADIRHALLRLREMDISMEGVDVLTGYKPASVGYNVATAVEFTVEVLDGFLDIALKFVHGRPWLSGLKVEKFVQGHDATLLHVVIDTSPVVLDQDSSGSEPVSFTGVGSHTHDPDEELLNYVEWEKDGDLLATTQNLTTDLSLGSHRVGLTIFDTKVETETLYSSTKVTVVPLTNVPGVLIKSYLDSAGSGSLLGPLGSVEAGYASVTPLFNAPRSKMTGRIYQIVSTLVVKDSPALFKITPVGGLSSVVLVNGEVASSTTFKLLSPGNHSIEARFRVTTEDQWPISLLRYKQNGAARLFDFSELEYDLTAEPPILSVIFPKRGSYLGGQSVFIDGIGFAPKAELEVQFGNATITGDHLIVSPLGDQIKFVAPGGEIGELQVTVKNSIGESAPVSFFSELNGPLPVQFTPIKTLLNLDFNAKPTRVTWGPDGRLYVGTFSGLIFAITVDEDYEVTEYDVLVGVNDQESHLVLGLAFNPAQNGPDVLYVAHGTINAQGGFCHEGRDAPYTGKVSLLTAPNYDKLTPLITGLPVSNHDHGINGIEFDTEGDMYVMVGGNTNAGIIHCALGELPESPFSAAMVKAPVLKAGFEGDIKYVNINTGEIEMDQKNGDVVDVAGGTDVKGFVYGFRNAYDLLFTQNGHFYATDNGPNQGFGLESTGPNTTGPDPYHKDELLYMSEGNYYGHPNHNRARTDPRQYKYYNLGPASIPGVFEQAMQELGSSSNGMDEYRSNSFNGALRGQIIVQKLNSVTYNIKIKPDGKVVDSIFESLLPSMNSLDVAVGPGGALVSANLKDKRVDATLPMVDTSLSEAHIYDIYPYRTAIGKGGPFIVSGHGFSRLGTFELFIGTFKATVTSHTDRRIYGTFPIAPTMPEVELQDVKLVAADGEEFVYEKGIQFLVGKTMNQAPRVGTWETLPDLPVKLGEVASAVVGNMLYAIGEGSPHTLGFNLETQAWMPVDTYAPRLHKGHHHCIEVYNGKIYVLGGLAGGSMNKVQIFDPDTNAWTSGQNIPTGSGSANSVLIGDKIYYCGGIVNLPGGQDTMNTCQIYSITTNTWSTDIAPMPKGRNHAAATTDGSKMYVIGGRDGGNWVANGFDDVQVYDVANNTWEDASATGSYKPLPLGRGGMGQALYHEGLIYVLGGETISGFLKTPKKVYQRVDVLNVATGKWTRAYDMPTGMHGHWAVKYNGKLYIAGGGVKFANSQSTNFFALPL